MSCKKITFCIFLSLVLSFCDSASILDFEFPRKCSITDGECLQGLISELMTKYRSSGVPELGIPRLDPYELKNATVSVLNMVDFILTDGMAEGASSCSLKKFDTVFTQEEKYITSESFCEQFKMSGRYRTEFGELAQSLLGKSISADGTGFIQIDKMTLKMKIPFEVQKLEDEEIYMIPTVSRAEYSTNEIESISFNATNVIFGGRDISEPLINFMNNNWKMINRSFGKFFSDRVMQTFYGYLMQYFPMVPASKYLNDEDLIDYVKVAKRLSFNEIVL